jgi:HPt (histidine-containing phosphotransfer) domain-containing protein
MQKAHEILVSDLQELIFVLTQDEWQPTEAKYRINVAYRGLSRDVHTLDTGLARLAGQSAKELEQHLLRNFKKYAHRDATPGDSVWNWLSVAQHHGLPTRDRKSVV